MHDMTLDPGALSATALLQAAREVSAAAMATPLSYFRAGSAIEQKPDESPVTAADRETEATLRAVIASRLPGHGILGAEYGGERLEPAIVWVVAPILATKSSTQRQ